MISLIVAMDRNGLIGHDGVIPWIHTEDLRNFRRLTLDHTVVMGRKTFDSIGGKPLPGRRNVVLTREEHDWKRDLVFHKSVHDILISVPYFPYDIKPDQFAHYEEGEVFVIGGRQVYQEFAPYVERMHITVINSSAQRSPEKGTYFPWESFAGTSWECVENYPLGDSFYYKYDFVSEV